MSPEVNLRRIARHSDQYSLAATFVELYLNRPLFESTDKDDLAHKHLTETPDLSAFSTRQQRVLLKALSKDPKLRYASCTAFADALTESFKPAWWKRREFLLAASVLLLMTLALVAVVSSSGTPPALPVWIPDGFEPAENAQLTTDYDRRSRYRDKIVPARPGLEDCLFLLIPKEQKTDLPTYYIMRDMVSNAVYAKFADTSTVSSDWQKGALTDAGIDLPVENASTDRRPVFRVTAYEARAFARWIGGELPSLRQWNRAAGFEPKAGETKFPPEPYGDSTGPDEIAVRRGESGPLEVGQAPSDRSKYGLRDMFGNGMEWTETHHGDGLPDDPASNPLLAIVGATYGEPEPLQFKDFATSIMDTRVNKNAAEIDEDIGFRVVLEVK